MCLNKAKIIEVTEDIVCYKVYICNESKKVVSPYMKSPIPELNTTVQSPLKMLYKDCVSEGFHSFTTIYDAKLEAMDWAYLDSIIMKCIIPKGSKCYKGEFTGIPSYCSDSIILVEQIETIFPNLNFE